MACEASTELSIVIIGSEACGKTSLLERFTEASFPNAYDATVAVEHRSRVMQVDDAVVSLSIWDTCGQQSYLWTAKKYLQKADGVMFLYDITEDASFAQLPTWIRLVNRCVKAKNLPRLLLGTKLDQKYRKTVPASQAREFAIAMNMDHVEASAKVGRNVNLAFYMLAKEILCWQKIGYLMKPSTSVLREDPPVIEMAEKIDGGTVNYTHLFRILLLGGSRVGKTAVRCRFCHDTFPTDYMASSGLEYSTRTVRIDRETIKLQIWDVGGDSVNDATRKSYYRGANGFVVMYDLTTPQSFSRVETLVEELKMYEQSDCPKILVGNKCDVTSSPDKMDSDQVKSFANTRGMPHIEVSARTGINVDCAFLKLAVALKKQMAPWKRLYSWD